MITRKESFQLLGLAETATEQEIRRKYRKLALKLHPDTNPDPKANEQFVILTLAVEIALSPEKANETAQRKSRTATGESEKARIARMKEAKQRFDEQQKKKVEENELYFRSLTTGKRWKIYKWVMRIGMILSFALILDQLLPYHQEEERVEGYSMLNHHGILEDKICGIWLRKHGFYYASCDRGIWSSSYPDIRLESTWFLHTPTYLHFTDDHFNYSTTIDFHIGSVSWYLVVLFLIPFIPYRFRYKKLSYVFLYQLSFWGIGLLEIYFLLFKDRFVHLISFGLF